jgi:hypothetical protein
MKAKGVAVYVENKSGSFYAVTLTDEQEQVVIGLIRQMHGGAIKIHKEKQPLERIKKSSIRRGDYKFN